MAAAWDIGLHGVHQGTHPKKRRLGSDSARLDSGHNVPSCDVHYPASCWRVVDRGSGWPAGPGSEPAILEIAEELHRECMRPEYLHHRWCLIHLRRMTRYSKHVAPLLEEVEANAREVGME